MSKLRRKKERKSNADPTPSRVVRFAPYIVGGVVVLVLYAVVRGGGTPSNSTTSEAPAVTTSAAPPEAPAVERATPGFVQVASAKDLTCGRTDQGAVLCWGDDAFSTKTLSGASVPAPLRKQPARVSDLDDATDLDVNAAYGCAVTKPGGLRCWVDTTVTTLDKGGGLPPSTITMTAEAVTVADAVQVRGSGGTTGSFCVVHRDGTGSCLDVRAPEIPIAAHKVQDLAGLKLIEPGDMHKCALTKDGRVLCWGGNLMGQTGMYTRSEPGAPAILEGATSLSSGSAFSCAVKDGRPYCWGSNSKHQTSGASVPQVEAPVVARAITGVRVVRAGVYHACAVTDAGHVRCWGDDQHGQSAQETDVLGIDDAIDVAVGEMHTCALLKSTKILCWGRNHRGQLGDGTTTDARSPRPVIVPAR